MGSHETVAPMQKGPAARAIGRQTLNEKEGAFRQHKKKLEKAAQAPNKTLSGTPGAIQ